MKLARGFWSAFIQSPLYDAPGSGSGGGGGQGTGAGAGGGTGAAAPGAGGGGSGAGGGGGTGNVSTIRLTDDSMVDFGDGTPVKWSDARSTRYVDRATYDRGVSFLQAEAQKLDAAWAKYREGTGPKPAQPQAKPDILDGLDDLSVIDGKMAAKLVRALREEGLGPIAQLVAQQQAELARLKQQMGRVGSVTGQVAETHQTQAFETTITTALSSLGQIKGLPDGVPLDPADPFLREAAKDLFLSHEQNSWQKGQFEKMLRDRVEGAIALTRALDKKALAAAGDKRRAFFNPNKGGGRPTGEPAYQHRSGSDMAAMLFNQLDGHT